MAEGTQARFRDLALAIRLGVADLEEIAARVSTVPLPLGDDLAGWALAALLHGWYSSLERVLTRCARDLGTPPTEGPGWHRHLLRSMTVALPGVRPVVLPPPLLQRLDHLLSFRHVVRNVYVLDLDPEKIAEVASILAEVDAPTRAALTAFARWLESTADELK